MAGKKESVSLAIEKADRFRTELVRRGVLLVPVIWGQGTAPKIEKKGFGLPSKTAAAIPSIGVRFEGSYLICPASIIKSILFIKFPFHLSCV